MIKSHKIIDRCSFFCTVNQERVFTEERAVRLRPFGPKGRAVMDNRPATGSNPAPYDDDLLRNHRELQRLFEQVEVAKTEWEQTMDCVPGNGHTHEHLWFCTAMQQNLRRLSAKGLLRYYRPQLVPLALRAGTSSKFQS